MTVSLQQNVAETTLAVVPASAAGDACLSARLAGGSVSAIERARRSGSRSVPLPPCAAGHGQRNDERQTDDDPAVHQPFHVPSLSLHGRCAPWAAAVLQHHFLAAPLAKAIDAISATIPSLGYLPYKTFISTSLR
jgi:hypothetical protein